ncbi:Uncharacterized protein Adt_23294 [Abeliophyllum distichum]|uniref:Uncharacterized protein n=1 Tax=Abeliophyllum distichum TaxID=126358 RepID=A0ABD1SC45_9LAMI
MERSFSHQKSSSPSEGYGVGCRVGLTTNLVAVTVAEPTRFESSEMLATFLTSTPLLEESWKLCHHANTALVQNFVVNLAGEVTYVAFLTVLKVCGVNSCSKDSVALGTAAEGFFIAFNCHDEGEELVMFHAGLLQLFLALYNTHITI